jgi:leucyl aminopeptidase
MRDASKLILPMGKSDAVPVTVLNKDSLPQWLKQQNPVLRETARSMGFDASPGSLLPFAGTKGRIAGVLAGEPASADGFALGGLASKLPPGHYRLAGDVNNPFLAALGWCLELYRYDPYRDIKPRAVTLECPAKVDRAAVIAHANAVFLVRDMINRPANLLGPQDIEQVARQVAARHRAKVTVVSGEKLRKEFPLVHAVGNASPRTPRLIDVIWGNSRHPKITLVGKGVCFDTGGLDIKPSSGMLLMKKDMGGAATVLGLASLIMQQNLPVRLRVIIPAVENAISGAAFRPGDVFKSRKGLTVEIGNTDAEGRLILADALSLADEESPDLLIDMATLTGAARVALGPDLPPFFTDDDALANEIHEAGERMNDPLWRLPLWRPYDQMIDTPIASVNNAGAGGFAGAITAALFLRRFVERAKSYVHFDIFAWTPNGKPGRPKGGEAMALRAVLAVLQKRYPKKKGR